MRLKRLDDKSSRCVEALSSADTGIQRVVTFFFARLVDFAPRHSTCR